MIFETSGKVFSCFETDFNTQFRDRNIRIFQKNFLYFLEPVIKDNFQWRLSNHHTTFIEQSRSAHAKFTSKFFYIKRFFRIIFFQYGIYLQDKILVILIFSESQNLTL